MVTFYDPNLRFCNQTVKVTLMQWGYKKTISVNISGNCKGNSIIESAAAYVYDDLIKDGGILEVTLTDSEGNTLHCQDDEREEERFIENMVVAVEIETQTPAKKASQ